MSQLAVADTLASGAQAVSEADFTDLVRDNQAMVFSIAYNFLRDQSLAEELAQDVFLQLYRNLDRLESHHHAKNWLRRTASHRCIDFTRKRSLAKEVDLDSVPEPSSEGAEPDPFLHDRLRKLVASLPEKKRLLVILRFQEEMELEEIAKVLKIPARTVRTQLWRTLALLREKAAHFLGETGPTGDQPVGGEVSE